MSTGAPSVDEIIVGPEWAGKRVDLFVGEALALSRQKLKALFGKDLVRVDGRVAKKGQLLVGGQTVRVEQLPQAPALVPDASIRLEVLWEDEALVFVDKPAGLPSHPLKPGEVGTVANALVARSPEVAAASEDPREGGLCHRLDVETSGVLLAAKTRAAWVAVREAFGRRAVDKRYLALVQGPLADEGEVGLPLRHHPRHAERMEATVDEISDAREALTHFRVLARQGALSLLEVRIETGVMHQIRVHLAAIGAPIVGDALYGGAPLDGLKRFFLHASRLGLAHPVTGAHVFAASSLPEDLAGALATLGLPVP